MDLQNALDHTRAIVADIVAPGAEGTDRDACWPENALRALQAAGLGGLVVPGALGGGGQGLFGLARVCETLGEHCPSTALCFGMHCVGASVISANPTRHQRETYLEPICAGRHLTTLSLSEPGTGVHFYFPQTTMRPTNGYYSLHGVKSFVTNGGEADSYVVSAVADTEDQDVPVFSCMIMPKTTEGLSFGPRWEGLGMRGNSSRTMELKGAKVSAESLLGKEGDQIWYVFNVIAPHFLMAMSGTYLGVASAAVEEARVHLAKRHYSHSGARLGEISLLQHRLGCLWAKVERTRQLIYSAAARYDAGESGALAAVMSAKAEIAGCAVDVVNDDMTIKGGIAYRDGSRLHRMLRDARAAHLMSPTTDLLRVWVGRALLGQPLLGD